MRTLIKRILAITIVFLIGLADTLAANLEFWKLDTNNGLPSSAVSCIFRDRSGFVWFGTSTGLSRFDGFRFRNFYSNATNKNSLKNNLVTDICEDSDGNLWIETSEGYCIFNPETEMFDRGMEEWMKSHGMEGVPSEVFIDHEKNFWIVVNGKGCYFYDVAEETAFCFEMGKGKNKIPSGLVSCITERGKSLVLAYNDGTLVRLDGHGKRVVWTNRHLKDLIRISGPQTFTTYIDKDYNYWILTNGYTLVYSSAEARWFGSADEFLSYKGIKGADSNLLVKAIQEDKSGNLWLATEHRGLFIVDIKARTITNYTYLPGNPTSLPDNTLQNLLIDDTDAVWIGTLKNGVAYYSPTLSRFDTIALGDICTIAQDKSGLYWFGTNDAGIICYNPATGTTARLGMGKTGLGSDVVVSSLCASDGSLWFGTFNGGMAHYKDGAFTVYRRAAGGLAHDCVWSLSEDRSGNIIIGTLGSGVQIFNPKNGTFKTFNTSNSKLPSDYIASTSVARNGDILLGHSQGFSIIEGKSHAVTNCQQTKSGHTFTSLAVNQVLSDRRGLIWNANMSGINVYDPKADRIYILSPQSQTACSVAEDRNGDIWVAMEHGIMKVKVDEKDGHWDFFITHYDELDGLQKRLFNFRSILLSHNGDIIVGGQDGINIITPHRATASATHAKAVFSGLILFDHPLEVGEEYNNRIVLDRSVNSSRMLKLRHSENAFTILLSSDRVSVPQKSRFQYRLKGFSDDKWLITAENQPSITYTNLSPGTYTLQVRVLDRDGSISPETSELTIEIAPPFWLSPWAFIVYIIVFSLIVWLVWHLTIHRQIEKLRIEQIRKEAEHNRKLDEMKLTFLTSISHELRTPLTLIISPLKAMLKSESDTDKKSKIELILRNANRLLNLVNQTLDLRKIEKNKAELNLVTGDVVGFVRQLCLSFKALSQNGISMEFSTEMEKKRMSFDDDKLEKIMTNLLSNAYKFTPENGHVSISLGIVKAADDSSDMLEIKVADNGKGISDEDKEHVFDRFYQVVSQKRSPLGGSGIGLNLVKEFAVMHGGNVTVSDNPGGGTVFTVTLPCRCDETLPALITDEIPVMPDSTGETEGKEDGEKRLTDVSEQLRKGEYEVLIVDDSEDFLSFMTEMLSDIYKVRVAHNGKEALQMVGEHKPDIILSDVMMPEMDGNELCRAIKENPKTERIPFVMLTARLSTDYKIEGMANGADDYITKPFNFDLLNLRICNLIKWHQATPLGEKIDPKIKPQEVTSLDEKLVKAATDYVESNLSNPDMSVETMSEALSMSRVHLYKRLLSVTGSTPSEFIRLIRLRHAEHLLRESQLNVSEVAYKVGFNNPRYFSKYFKEMYGVMPSQYKKTDDGKSK